MADKILARQHPEHKGTYQWLVVASEPPIIHEGSLAQLAASADHNAVLWLIPAADVLHLEISLPIKSTSQIKKALPYAIEDLLALEVENYQLAWCKLAGDLIAVAAIELATLHRYEEACQQAGIRLSGMYSELLFMPFATDSISVVIEQNTAILRFGLYQGGGIELAMLPLVLDKLIAEQQLPHTLTLWQNSTLPALNWPDSLEVEAHPLPSTLALLATHMPKKPELNLLSARFALGASGQQSWLAWLPTAALLVLATGLQWGAALQQHWHSESLLKALDSSNQQTFRETFPELKRIVNIKAQAQQELVALRKIVGQRHDKGFLSLLYQTGEILAHIPANEAPQLQSMDFSNNMLSLSLKAADNSQLEAFTKKLQQTGLKADIRSAETADNSVQAHLDISPTNTP